MIQFIFNSTEKPILLNFEEQFYNIFNKEYLQDIEQRNGNDINVFIVNERDFEREENSSQISFEEKLSEKPDRPVSYKMSPDYLGLHIRYIKPHELYGKEAILICPERIMECSKDLHKSCCSGVKLDDIYQTILNKVIIHELGHWILCDCTQPNPAITPVSFSKFYDTYCYKTIEESLANAFTLINNFSESEKEIISQFIEQQSSEYRAGLNWESDIVFESMTAWRRTKLDFYTILETICGDCMQIRTLVSDKLFFELLNRLLDTESKPIRLTPDFSTGAFRALRGEVLKAIKDDKMNYPQISVENTIRHIEDSCPKYHPPANSSSPSFLQNKTDIENWLIQHKIEEYTIRKCNKTKLLIIDINGDIDLAFIYIKELPVKFGVVIGDFVVNNNDLNSYDDLPDKVNGCLDIRSNKLKKEPKNILLLPELTSYEENSCKADFDGNCLKIYAQFVNANEQNFTKTEEEFKCYLEVFGE